MRTTLALLLLPSLAAAQTYGVQPEAGALNIKFGQAVAINSSYAVVSAPRDQFIGSVYIYQRSDGGLLHKIMGALGPGWSTLDFGAALALRGDALVVGSPGGGFTGDEGIVGLYDCTTGQHTFGMIAPDRAPFDRFGASVAMNGSLIVIGSPGDDDSGSESGSVYVYSQSNGAFLGKIHALNGMAGQRFGSSIAVDGNTVVIGAPADTSVGTSVGSAYVFDLTNGAQIAHITSPSGQSSRSFGSSVAVSGQRALIGAQLDGDNGASAGAAYLFDTQSGGLIHKLKPNNGGPFQFFGFALALDGDTAMVSAPWAGQAQSYTGSAYLFDVASGIQTKELLPPQSVLFQTFGASVALNDQSTLVGADFLNGGSSNLETAYVGNIPNTGSPYCFGDGTGVACPCANTGGSGEGCLNRSGSGATLSGIGTAYSNVDEFALVVTGAPANTPGLFFQGASQVSLPLGNGILCTQAALRYGVTVTDNAGGATQQGLNANAQSGSTLNYQFWFRDQNGSCGGSFNFSGGWTVTWF